MQDRIKNIVPSQLFQELANVIMGFYPMNYDQFVLMFQSPSTLRQKLHQNVRTNSTTWLKKPEDCHMSNTHSENPVAITLHFRH
jgi:hypothetical protein